uniref:Uncharacterized protein n=1 Tax=Anopheles coluzzii TaxID=1518534 RepID=A0A8W7PLK0_ANOCL
MTNWHWHADTAWQLIINLRDAIARLWRARVDSPASALTGTKQERERCNWSATTANFTCREEVAQQYSSRMHVQSRLGGGSLLVHVCNWHRRNPCQCFSLHMGKIDI